jgi:entry exclusion lipoprotein TrbK
MISAKRLSAMALVILFIALISACSTETPSTPNTAAIPEVNDENCMTENIKKIEDKEAREAFAGLCIRRGSFVASPKKAW